MAPKKSSSSSRNWIITLISAAFVLVVILGAFGIVDTVAMDNALEPILVELALKNREIRAIEGGGA